MRARLLLSAVAVVVAAGVLTVMSITAANAQTAPCRPVAEVDALQFFDESGELDLDAYLAAVAAANEAASEGCGGVGASGDLPRTGSALTDALALSVALLAVGAPVVYASRRRRLATVDSDTV